MYVFARNLCLLCNAAEAAETLEEGERCQWPKTSTKEADSGCAQANDNYKNKNRNRNRDLQTGTHTLQARTSVRVCVCANIEVGSLRSSCEQGEGGSAIDVGGRGHWGRQLHSSSTQTQSAATTTAVPRSLVYVCVCVCRF